MKNLWRWFVRQRDKSTQRNGNLVALWNCHWRVLYPDGKYSIKFYYSQACDYANIFGGQVVYVRYEDPS